MTRPARGFRVNHELTIEMALTRKADRSWVPPDEREEHQRILSRMEIDDWPWGLIPVTTRSRLGLRRAVFLCALYFRREMHYDFVQYGWNGVERLPACGHPGR